MTLTEPSLSSAPSSTVATESVTLAAPAASVTLRCPAPGASSTSPLWATVKATVRSAAGAESAVMVKTAFPPSSTAEPAERLSSGTGAGTVSGTGTGTGTGVESDAASRHSSAVITGVHWAVDRPFFARRSWNSFASASVMAFGRCVSAFLTRFQRAALVVRMRSSTSDRSDADTQDALVSTGGSSSSATTTAAASPGGAATV